jgi:hypothetical protein
LRPNFGANFVGQAVWQWNIVQIGSHFLAIFKGPIKELQGFVGGSLVSWFLYIKMKEAVLIGQLVSPLALTIDTPMPGTLNQSAPAAAAANVKSSGLTYLPLAF